MAELLFGEESLCDDRKYVKEHIRKFLDAVMVEFWQKYRKSITREVGRITKGRDELTSLWNGRYHLRQPSSRYGLIEYRSLERRR